MEAQEEEERGTGEGFHSGATELASQGGNLCLTSRREGPAKMKLHRWPPRLLARGPPPGVGDSLVTKAMCRCCEFELGQSSTLSYGSAREEG